MRTADPATGSVSSHHPSVQSAVRRRSAGCGRQWSTTAIASSRGRSASRITAGATASRVGPTVYTQMLPQLQQALAHPDSSKNPDEVEPSQAAHTTRVTARVQTAVQILHGCLLLSGGRLSGEALGSGWKVPAALAGSRPRDELSGGVQLPPPGCEVCGLSPQRTPCIYASASAISTLLRVRRRCSSRPWCGLYNNNPRRCSAQPFRDLLVHHRILAAM